MVKTYEVAFERVGRGSRGHVERFEVAEGNEADGLAEAIFRFARTRLASRWFDVVLDLEAGDGSIEAGRFGTFTFKEIVSA